MDTAQSRTAASRNLVPALIIILLAGALLVRLRDNLSPPTVPGATGGDRRSVLSHTTLHPGTLAPDFTLPGLDGRPFSLGQYLGKPVLINFWASWCGPCQYEMPAIQAAYEARREDGFVVLAVAVDDSAQNVRDFFDKHELTFVPLMDDGSVSDAYYVFGLPTSYFVGSDGTIAAVHAGPLTESQIEAYLSSLD